MSLSDPLAVGVCRDLHETRAQWYLDTASQASFDFRQLFYQKNSLQELADSTAASSRGRIVARAESRGEPGGVSNGNLDYSV